MRSHEYKSWYRYRKLVTFRFNQRLQGTYEEKKNDWIQRERLKNSTGLQRWKSAQVSMLIDKFMRHKDDYYVFVIITRKDQCGKPSRIHMPMSWFREQVMEDVVNKREFVFRIKTQGFFSVQDMACRGVARIQKENIEYKDMFLVVDDEPLISDSKMPLMPEDLQESKEEEAKCEEELLVLNGEECREETKAVKEGEIQDTDRKGKGEENKEMLPSNAQQEDKEAGTICEKRQESPETDREGGDRATPPAHAASPDVGVVRRVASVLLKVVLAVVVVVVFLDAFLPQLPEE